MIFSWLMKSASVPYIFECIYLRIHVWIQKSQIGQGLIGLWIHAYEFGYQRKAALSDNFFAPTSLVQGTLENTWISASHLVHCSAWLLLLLVSSRRPWFPRRRESHSLIFQRFIIPFARLPLDERDTAWMWLALRERVVGQLDGDTVGISIQKKESCYSVLIYNTKHNFVWNGNGCVWSKIQEACWTTEMFEKPTSWTSSKFLSWYLQLIQNSTPRFLQYQIWWTLDCLQLK